MIKLDCFKGTISSEKKKYGYQLSVEAGEDNYIELHGTKGRIYGTKSPSDFDKCVKSILKTGAISHYLLEERKDYKKFYEEKSTEGLDPKEITLNYFKNLI